MKPSHVYLELVYIEEGGGVEKFEWKKAIFLHWRGAAGGFGEGEGEGEGG